VSVTAGRLAFSVAASGVLTSLSLHGHVLVDICAALSWRIARGGTAI